MSSVDKIKWAMSLRDPQYEALQFFDAISSKIEYRTSSKAEAEKIASENCQAPHTISVDKEFDFPSFCFDMTTGIGKSRLMGACIYYLYKTKGYKHFFILAPGNTIYDKMRRESVPGHPKYMFKGLEAEMGRPKVYDGENYLSYPVRYVQEELVVEKTSDIQIFIFNISKIFTRGDVEFKFHKFNENLGGSFADVLRSFDDLVICINATAIKSSFIPDYEIPSVSAQIDDMSEHAFSMLHMGSPKKKSEVIQNLRTLTEMYGSWITDALTKDEAMQDDKFKVTGQSIIDKCNDANRRMNVGIDLIENNDKVYQAFVFMNQAMYLQRSITAFSKDYGNGIPCSLRDYMTDMPEKGRKKDHSEWRPFQIAFVLLNLYGIMEGESPERDIVDLLYFPTGGGKTEAYLGLIAFTIAYRRLTASDETEYEKDGGVTVFLRYTLRLLTTQQRDRLMRLIVAMEQLREKNEKLYGKERITIGFWVGGNVTPNKFSEYSDSDQFKKKEFIRKLTKQIIKCPYCGKPITRDEYDINEKGKYVKIHCSDDNCMFSLRKGRTIPVYLVDEEIYAKCPTVIISTVDKFARLPWSEQVGLLFGRTDRCCSRCGHIAIGEKHVGRHNADVALGLEKAETVACKPFYPPELIIQDELHLITGPLGTIYGGYETVVEEMCCIDKNGKKIRPKYIVSTATIRNAGEQIKFLYGRNEFAQFPPSGFDTRDSFFIKEVPLPTENLVDVSDEKISKMISDGKKPFRQYVGICASGQSVKTTLIRLYSIILQTALDIAKDPEYEDYIDPYYTLIGYFNSIRELGGAVRLLDDDIASRIRVVKNKYNSPEQRYLSIDRKTEITSRIPSWNIAQVLEKLAIPYDKNQEKQACYDVVIATNMIAVGMDVDRLGLMSVVGQPKQNSEYIQATSRVGRQHPGIIFTVYNPYRPRDLSNYENFVGFHSQMYRYVEGTTATPFAARARDRVLHALVVSLLRLQVEEMADNSGASNINDISDEQIKDIKGKILERVKITAPVKIIYMV